MLNNYMETKSLISYRIFMSGSAVGWGSVGWGLWVEHLKCLSIIWLYLIKQLSKYLLILQIVNLSRVKQTM